MPDLLSSLGVERPVVQAGMGGGISRHELAAAVSEAGGLGTIGTLPEKALAAELAAARRLTDRPIAVNLLLPFAGRTVKRAAVEADLVVTFWGKPDRPGPKPWLHQCGSVEEARTAAAAGADGVIAQGVEAGGHVRGTTAALVLLDQLRGALPDGYPILLAGGIAGRSDLERAMDAGATAGVLGTRFLLSEESRAHPEYKRRLLDGKDTQLTEIFGLGWPAAPHRVLPNRATARWIRTDPRGSRLVRALNRGLSPAAKLAPDGLQQRLASTQRPTMPMLSPRPATDDGPDVLVESGPLYAGATVARISDLRPAAEILGDLSS